MNTKLKRIAAAGMFSAMVFVLTMFVKIPVATGYVHFGDALVYVCAVFLGVPWACVAGAIGEGLADVAGGFAMYAPATVVVKVLMVLPFLFAERKKPDKLLTVRSGVMTVPAGVVTVLGYLTADLIISRAYAIVNIPGNVVQAVGSAIIFIFLTFALDRANIRQRISF